MSLEAAVARCVADAGVVARQLSAADTMDLVDGFVALQTSARSLGALSEGSGVNSARLDSALLTFKTALAQFLAAVRSGETFAGKDRTKDELKLLLSDVLLELKQMRERFPHEDVSTIECAKKMATHLERFLLLVREGDPNERQFLQMTKTTIELLKKLERSRPNGHLSAEANISFLTAEFIKRAKALLFSETGSTEMCVSLADNISFKLREIREACGERFFQESHVFVPEKQVGPLSAPKVQAWGAVKSTPSESIPSDWESMQKTGILYSDGHGLKGRADFEPSVGVTKTQIRNPMRNQNSNRAAPASQKLPPVPLDSKKKEALEEVEAILEGKPLVSADATDFEKFHALQEQQRAARTKTSPVKSSAPAKQKDRAAEINARNIREQQSRQIAQAAPKSIVPGGMKKI